MELECVSAQEKGQAATDLPYRINQSSTDEQHGVNL